jgi:hypothetical protein
LEESLDADVTHHGLAQGVAELQGAQELHFETRQNALAEEVLEMAVLTYGLLLEMSERTVQHGLTSEALRIVTAPRT